MCGTSLAAPTAVGREERKVVSVLFCDLVGFTSRSESMDVEDVRGTLQPYHELLRRTIESYGGTVEKFIGDAVMALFGAPVVHEDDPERAVRAALGIVSAVAALRDANPALNLHVRLGVNTGEALVALDADPLRGEGMASGDVVNTAARLESAAPVDGVLVGEATCRATSRVISYQPVEPVSAKGKSEPVLAWQAVEARSRFGVDVDQGSRAAMVGRDREFDALRGSAERAFEAREVQLVTIVGVPGIGKSRLVWELSRWAEGLPALVRWRQGRCLPYGEGVTFWALGEVLKAQAGILESDSADEAGEKLHHMISSGIADESEAAWLRRHVDALVGAENDRSGDGSSRDELFAAWRRLFEALAGSGAIVVVFEDLHWADDAMLDFIDYLVEWAADVPLLVVCTARPELLERRRDWGGGKPNAATIALRPLSGNDTDSLVSNLLEQIALPEETRNQLIKHAEGNPLYAEEYVRMLVEQGSGAAGVLPDNVQGIIAARLDALPTEEKQLLQDAAVLGKVVWQRGLAAISETEAWELDEMLHKLARKEFLRRAQRSSINGDTEYAFRHVLVRDVAYGQIPRAQRADKHLRAAAWIATLSSGRDDSVEMRAHHLMQAFEYASATGQDTTNLRRQALQALHQAGERASRLDAFAAAASHYQAALDLAPNDDRQRGHLLLELGRARLLNGDPASEPLEHAIELLAPTDPAAAAFAHTRLALINAFAGNGEVSLAHDTRARELLEGAPDSSYRARVLLGLGMSAVVETRPADAIRLLDDYLASSDTGDPRWLIGAHVYRGLARVEIGDRDGMNEATAAVDELRSQRFFELHVYLSNLATSHLFMGHVAQFRELNAEALEQLPPQMRRRATGYMAEIAFADYLTGRWEGALATAAECEAGAQAGTYDSGMSSEWQGMGARILARRGSVADAVAAQGRSLEAARDEQMVQALVPELAESTWMSFVHGQSDQATLLLAELLERTADPSVLLTILPYISAELADTVESLGKADVFRQQLSAVPLDTPWSSAMLAALDGDHGAAAEAYDSTGSVVHAAYAHLRAAETHSTPDSPEAQQHRMAASMFYQSVNANLYLDRIPPNHPAHQY